MSSKDEDEHKIHLKAVFQHLKEQQIYLKLSKCQFFLRKVHWLGYVILEDGIEVDDRKVEAIKKIEIPNNISQVQSFLGLVNYYRWHLKNLTEVALPLTELTKDKNTWTWGHGDNKNRKHLKRLST